jgi:hypothetical protein
MTHAGELIGEVSRKYGLTDQVDALELSNASISELSAAILGHLPEGGAEIEGLVMEGTHGPAAAKGLTLTSSSFSLPGPASGLDGRPPEHGNAAGTGCGRKFAYLSAVHQCLFHSLLSVKM